MDHRHLHFNFMLCVAISAQEMSEENGRDQAAEVKPTEDGVSKVFFTDEALVERKKMKPLYCREHSLSLSELK